MKKRIVSLVLVLALVCSLGITAFAASNDPVAAGDIKGAAYTDVAGQSAAIQEAIYGLTALGVLEGDGVGTTYRPADTLTRAEFAKIIYYFAGFETEDLAYFESLTPAFPDIVDGTGYGWAKGYINACAKYGYVIGYEDGTYRPGNIVTMQEVVTVLLRIAGYNDALPGVWPYDYNEKAVNVGLTKYVNFIGGAPATRGAVASLAYETLDLEPVVYVEDATAAGLGYVQGTVDADGFAWETPKTNEYGDTWLLSTKVFGVLVIKNVVYAGWDADTNDEMVEASGWDVADLAKGQLELNADDLDWALASTYYLVGGNLVDLGGTKGNLLWDWDADEVLMATTNGTYAHVDADADKVCDYAENFEHANFGIVDGLFTDRLGKNYILFKNTENAQVLASDIFWNATTEKFVAWNELVDGDVVYYAGAIDDADLFLVYNVKVGEFTEITAGAPTYDPAVTISGVDYGYDCAWFSIDGGATVDSMDYEDVEEAVISQTTVAYIPSYIGNEVCYVFANVVPETTVVKGVVTGYNTTVSTSPVPGVVEGTLYQYVSGIEVFTEAGTTVTYDTAALLSQGAYPALGDLAVLTLNENDVILANGIDLEVDIPTNTDVAFNPVAQVGGWIFTDVENGRVQIGGDWYWLAEDAVIFSLSASPLGTFESVELTTAADFLARGTQKVNQVAIYEVAVNDLQEIVGLYVVNPTGVEQTFGAIATKASIKNQQAIITLLGGEELVVASDAFPGTIGLGFEEAWELFAAGVPAFISFRMNEDGTIFDVNVVVNENDYWLDQFITDFNRIQVDQGVFEMDDTYAMFIAHVGGITPTSVVLEDTQFDGIDETLTGDFSGTYFYGNATMYDFAAGKELTMNAFGPKAEDPALYEHAVVVVDTKTHEIAYMFPAELYSVNYYVVAVDADTQELILDDNGDPIVTEYVPEDAAAVGAGDTVTIATHPEVIGGTFDGWYDADDNTVNEGSEVRMPYGGLALIGAVEYTEYIIGYSRDGLDVEKIENQPFYTLGGSVTLTAEGYEKENYTFKGWATTSGGALAYTAGQTLTGDDLAAFIALANADGVIYLYPVFEGVPCDVIFMVDGEQLEDADGPIKVTVPYGTTVQDVIDQYIEGFETVTWNDTDATIADVGEVNVITGATD